MENLKKSLPWILRVLVAAMFLLSAYAKLYPSANLALGTFEAKQLIPLGFSESFAPYFSRFIIAAEFSIGIGLLQPHYFKRFVIPVAIFLLSIFCVQLVYEMSSTGNSGNCGCFGSLLPMTPLQALIKNIVAIGMLGYLWKVSSDDKQRNFFAYPMLIFTSLAAIMYAYAPVQLAPEQPTYATGGSNVHPDFADFDEDTTGVIDSTHMFNGDTISKPKSVASVNPDQGITEPPKPKGPPLVKSKFSDFPTYIPPAIKIDKGKKILCMFAPGCEHCQATIKALTEMRKEIPNMPPIHIVFMDEEPEKIPEFFKIAGREYSYTVATVTDFWKILDFSRDTPGVCYLYNGNIMYFADGINEKEFTKAGLKKALEKDM